MSWFFIALIGPLLYAMTNYIDKILLEKVFKEGGVGTILLFSSLVSVFALPFIFLMDRTAFSVGVLQILILAVVGVLNALVLWFYLIALEDEEASIVVVFYQLVPVMGSILGYFIIGETLIQSQIIAMAIIILGTTIISFEIDAENKFKLRRKTILPMLGAGFCWALGGVLFKSIALQENLWRSLFWEHLMMTLVGVLIFIFIRSYRNNFLVAMRENTKKALSLNFLNETLYIAGNVVVAFTYLLAPVGLVLLTESFQPIFVLGIGLFLTFFFPKITTEKVHAKHIWQKVIAIAITGIGTYLLLNS
ncbi:MAG: DMT family transporter [bacterium]|jgi:drug/metabolite transporter (DMT)-like permease